MLRTNSKQAKENVKNYIMEHFDGCNYGIETPATFEETAKIINETFEAEKFVSNDYARRLGLSRLEVFIDWCAGLPSILDTCYYYNRSAVDDLGEILEETDDEKGKYSEGDAEKLLSTLIYREIEKGV